MEKSTKSRSTTSRYTRSGAQNLLTLRWIPLSASPLTHYGSGSRIFIKPPGQNIPFIFVSHPATTFPSSFTHATLKRPEVHPHWMKNGTGDLLMGLHLMSTADQKAN